MNAELKSAWVKALRSGEFEQTRGELADEAHAAFCCIGVGYKVCIGGDLDSLGSETMDRTHDAARSLGLSPDQQLHLVVMNDSERKSFPQIADYIEANL